MHCRIPLRGSGIGLKEGEFLPVDIGDFKGGFDPDPVDNGQAATHRGGVDGVGLTCREDRGLPLVIGLLALATQDDRVSHGDETNNQQSQRDQGAAGKQEGPVCSDLPVKNDIQRNEIDGEELAQVDPKGGGMEVPDPKDQTPHGIPDQDGEPKNEGAACHEDHYGHNKFHERPPFAVNVAVNRIVFELSLFGKGSTCESKIKTAYKRKSALNSEPKDNIQVFIVRGSSFVFLQNKRLMLKLQNILYIIIIPPSIPIRNPLS